MSAVETVKVKADTPRGYRIINKSSFDPKVHKAYDAEARRDKDESDAEKLAREESEKDQARRKVEANRGQVEGSVVADGTKNPSGTFSEPTPTDIRYPNKQDTEFENNMGAFVNKSAAQIRAENGMEDKPGGLNPEKKEAEDAKVAEAKMANKLRADGESGELKKAADGDKLDKMKAAELRAYAEEHGIDLEGATTKAEVLEKVKASGK